MAKKNEFDLIENPEAVVEASLGKVESFVNTNKQRITQILGGAIALFALVWAYNHFIAGPHQGEKSNSTSNDLGDALLVCINKRFNFSEAFGNNRFGVFNQVKFVFLRHDAWKWYEIGRQR